MNLSAQLRIILLLVGAAIWLAIYLFGKRNAARDADAVPATTEIPQATKTTPGFTPAEEQNDDEFETPAYMRRQGQREPRQDYEPRIANAHDYVDMDEVRDDDPQFVDAGDRLQVHAAFDAQESVLAKRATGTSDFDAAAQDDQHEPVYSEPRFNEPVYVEPAPVASAASESVAEASFSRREPTITLDEFVVTDSQATGHRGPDPAGQNEPERALEVEPPTLPNIPVVEHPVDAAAHGYVRRTEAVASSELSAAPTLSDAVQAPVESVAARTASVAPPGAVAPAPGANTGKSAGNAARRKIIALRIPMPERVQGVQLLSLLQGEHLEHGKFSIFHRMQNSGAVFSVASMVEPGTFDPQVMGEQQFPGVTLFMLLPGPLDGLVAWDQMLSCAQRIAHTTGGVLQDERGSKLAPQTIEKLRDEVLDFQHLIGSMATFS
jgi:cell division protein ZipA